MLLREKVAQLIDRGHYKKDIAKVGQVAHQTIVRFVDGVQIDLHVALRLIRHYWPEEEQVIIRDLCQNEGLKNLRNVLEYFIISGDLVLAESMIQKLKQSKKRHDNEWARAYEVELLRNRGQLTPQEIVYRLDGTFFETPEMRIYSKILLVYAYHDLKYFDFVRSNFADATLGLPRLKNEYIQQGFELRLGQIRAYMHLVHNELTKCRSYATALKEDVMQSSLAASLLHIIGNSYMFENPEEAMKYLEQSRRIYLDKGRANAQRKVENTMNFLQTFHGQEARYLQLTEDIYDIQAVTYYHISKGEHDLAQNLLHQVDIEKLNHYEKALHFFYLAELTSDHDYYSESISEFKLTGNHFLRQLPIRRLEESKQYSVKLIHALSI